MTKSTSKKIAIGFSFLLVIGLALYLSEKRENDALLAQKDEFIVTKQEEISLSTPITSSNQIYKDGVYNAVGSYNSPAGNEKVEISVTLKNDSITDSTFKGEAINPTSKNRQAKFGAEFKSKVVGKKISEVSLTAVGGSSLTTKAFMEALLKIETEAKA